MDFVEYYKNLHASRLRRALVEIRDSAVMVDHQCVADACRFLTREDDFDQVMRKNEGRYSRVLVESGKDTDPATSLIAGHAYGSYEPYFVVQGSERIKFQHGIYETICTGVAQTICHTTANMFTSYEQTWKFLQNDEDSEYVDSLIKLHREQGGFDSKICECDFLASGVDSCILHIYPKGEWLCYDAVWPSSVYLVYGDTVQDTMPSGRHPRRAADMSDIEDASAVIIRLRGHDRADRNRAPDENVYQAYVGAYDGNELGRMVTYRGRSFWPIPEIGDSKILTEYTRIEGGVEVVCNPLTYVMRRGKYGIGGGYEYPICVIKGDQRFGCGDAIPTTLTFYRSCLEIEAAWSQILRQGVISARGKDVITLGVAGDKLPESLDVVVVPPGCSYQYLPGNAAGVAQGIETLTAVTRGVAGSRGVPPYVIIGSAPSQPESGVALALRTQPLIDSRNRRIKMQREQIAKIYQVESALLCEMFPDLEKPLSGVTQAWNPGQWQVPKDMSTKLADLETARNLETIDQVETVRQANGLSTDAEAEALIEMYADRDPDYKGLGKTEEKPAVEPPVPEEIPGEEDIMENDDNQPE